MMLKKMLATVLFTVALVGAQPQMEFNKGTVDADQSLETYEGCGLSCALDWTTSASSELAPSGGNRYGVKQLEDVDFKTCWAEGVAGPGIGESLEFRFKSESKAGAVPFSGFAIKNGYTKSDDVWAKNGRVKEFGLTVNGKELGTLTLLDTSKSQFVSLRGVQLSSGDVVRLTIKSVYPGSKYQDTCVSEILLMGAH
jgi:hypothetical protein